jgi:hypothetical protein
MSNLHLGANGKGAQIAHFAAKATKSKTHRITAGKFRKLPKSK